MKDKYFDIKNLKPNKIYRFKLYPRESGKSNYEYHKMKKDFNRQKRGKDNETIYNFQF